MATSTRKVVVSLDTYLSILAVVSSFCAIGITFYQAYLQRTQQYASAWPYLTVYNNNVPENKVPRYLLNVGNKGVGPAIIQSVEIWYENKKIEDEYTLVRKVVGSDTNTTVIFSNLWKGRVISPDEQVDWIQVRGPGARKLEDGFSDNKIKLRILFASIYDEKWYLNLIPKKPLVEKIDK